MLLALVMTAMTASAMAGYTLSVGTNEHGTIAFSVNGHAAEYASEGDEVTVTITPDDDWSTGTVKGLWYAAEAAKGPRRVAAANIDLLKDFDLTPVEGDANAFTFTMKRANVEVSATYRKMLTHQDITIEDIEAVTYNGQAQQPAVTVKDGTTTLVLGTDYTVAYSNNVNAGTATATITAAATSENYAGDTATTFTIEKAAIAVTAPTPRVLTYNGEAQTLIDAATQEGDGNMDGCQILYSLNDIAWSTKLPQGIDAGMYTMLYKVEANANHNAVEVQSVDVPIYSAQMTAVTLAQTELQCNIFEP